MLVRRITRRKLANELARAAARHAGPGDYRSYMLIASANDLLNRLDERKVPAQEVADRWREAQNREQMVFIVLGFYVKIPKVRKRLIRIV